MVAGFTTIPIKDGAGATQNLAVYVDGSGNVYPAPTGTDAVGNILGLSTTPVYNFAPVPSKFTGSTLTRSPNNGTAYSNGQVVYAGTGTAQAVTYTVQTARVADQASTILRVGLTKSGTSITNAVFRVHLFSGQPTLTNGDNATWLSTVANWVGAADVTVNEIGSDKSIGVGVPNIGSTISSTPVSGQNYMYYEIEARAAYAPGQGETFTPWVEVQ